MWLRRTRVVDFDWQIEPSRSIANRTSPRHLTKTMNTCLCRQPDRRSTISTPEVIGHSPSSLTIIGWGLKADADMSCTITLP